MKQKSRLKLFFLIAFIAGTLSAHAQDPHRYDAEIGKLQSREFNFDSNKKTIVFAGSSSIRKWEDVAGYFPGYNVVNNGFGGSHFSDLIFFYDKLILKYKPDYLFIYEGDNDIAANEKPGKIYKEAKGLIKRIRTDLPETKIIIIAPKPSIARWNLKKEYLKLNKKLDKFCRKTDNTEFADVWKVMLDDSGMVFQDIFINDGLHMNKKGYDIWGEFLKKYLN